MRESAFSKARRYLTEGRLTVIEVSETRISALCRGDGTTYALGYRGADWFCGCPAASRSCSHLTALKLVAVIQRKETA